MRMASCPLISSNRAQITATVKVVLEIMVRLIKLRVVELSDQGHFSQVVPAPILIKKVRRRKRRNKISQQCHSNRGGALVKLKHPSFKK